MDAPETVALTPAGDGSCGAAFASFDAELVLLELTAFAVK
jgi:hypothetical protein